MNKVNVRKKESEGYKRSRDINKVEGRRLRERENERGGSDGGWEIERENMSQM